MVGVVDGDGRVGRQGADGVLHETAVDPVLGDGLVELRQVLEALLADLALVPQ